MLTEVRVEKVLKQPEQMEKGGQDSVKPRVGLERHDTEQESLRWGRGGEPSLPRAPGMWSAGCHCRELFAINSGQLEKQICISPSSTTTSLPLL